MFWVHASNAARFEQSCQEIADCVKIPGRQDPKANIFKLVHDWLRGSKGQWMLILDNVDDAKFLVDTQPHDSGSASKPLREYLPQSQNGSILITTRSREAALKLVEPCDVIAVDPMDEAHALVLFEKKLGVQEDSNDIAELAGALEFMPLAIVQAAAYISERAPRCSVRQYLEQFRKSDRKRMTLLDHEGGQLRRDREAKNSIIITWQISFDHIRETRPSAADLLSLMSFFDPQGIPEYVLQHQARHENDQEDQVEFEEHDIASHSDIAEDASSQPSASDEFEDDVQALRNFSFISISPDGATFEMHRLVQLATRKWMEAHGQLKRWNRQFIRNLSAKFPTGEYENWWTCQVLFPHAKSAATTQPKEESLLAEWAKLLYHAAWYAWRKGSTTDAETLALKSMEARSKLFGQEHVDTLNSMDMVERAYYLGGRWKEVEELDVQLMKTRKRVLGPEHPHTLISMANLASTYSKQGRWNQAEELQAKDLETCKRVLGAEHPDTLISMANLASTYRMTGRWKEAEELEVQVMQTHKRVLGPEHPHTLTSMANLASTYRNQGRWKEAEELDVQVMETSLRVLGAEHPSTLISIGNLASTYSDQGRWEEAEALQAQVLETHKRVLGEEHPDTLTSMANLASAYRNQGRWKEAEELEVQVTETRKRVLGPEHPDTLTSIANLASTYSKQDRWKEAEELEMQVKETRKRVLGPKHPDTLTSMANLASTYRNQDRWKEAEELEVQVTETRKRVLSPEHPHTLTSMANLASTYSKQGRSRPMEPG